MNIVLGISNGHNGGVALICDGEVKSAIQAERISRKKRQTLGANEETQEEIELINTCVQYCLDDAGVQHQDINSVAIATSWRLKKRGEIDGELFRYIGGVPKNYIETFYVGHHFAHMEYIVHYGDLKPGIVLVIDGSGSWEIDRQHFNVEEEHHPQIINLTDVGEKRNCKETISAYWFDGSKSTLIYRFCPDQFRIRNHMNFMQSIGHYWRWASLYCTNSINEAGSVMGLAAFGEDNNLTDRDILRINNNGYLFLDFEQIYKHFRTECREWEDLSDNKHCQNLARQVQSETESVIMKLLNIITEKFPAETLYFCGGVALNVIVNEKIKNSNIFKNVILNSSVEDNGTAIGAGLAASIKLGCKRKVSTITDYYGRIYNSEEIMEAISQFDFTHETLNPKRIFEVAADLIGKKKILGWFQGRSEFGPRALGNRSILANPINPDTKFILDNYIKNRASFRPYAPVVIEEKASQYFDIDGSSPVMMRNVKVLDKELVAITHFDGTARVQTVNKKENETLYSLLLEVEKSIGYPILLNTSFNLSGEPIVESPFDALKTFSKSSLDYLFLGNILVSQHINI